MRVPPNEFISDNASEITGGLLAILSGAFWKLWHRLNKRADDLETRVVEIERVYVTRKDLDMTISGFDLKRDEARREHATQRAELISEMKAMRSTLDTLVGQLKGSEIIK